MPVSLSLFSPLAVLAQAPLSRANDCSRGWKNIVALHWEEENPDPGRDCFTDIIVICPTQLKFTLDESVLPKQDGGPGGYSKAQMCDDAGLVSKGEEWEKFGGT